MRNFGRYSLPSADSVFAFNQDSFEKLFQQYKNLVYRTALFMLGDAAEAEDALQEVFVLVYKSLASFDPQKGAFTTWLYRITLNYCLGYRRKRQLLYQSFDQNPSLLAEMPIEMGLPVSDEKEAMLQAIGHLSEKQRVVVLLRYYWELPYAEIAQILDVPLGTVKSRIALAIRNLRQKLITQDELGNVSSPEEEMCL